MQALLINSIFSFLLYIGFPAAVDAGWIHEFTRHGDWTGIQQQLENGVDINAVDNNGRTALVCAIGYGHIEIATQLLQIPGINVNIPSKNNWTALKYAVACNYKELVIQLLQIPGIDVYAKDGNGNTALDIATNEEIKQLIENHILQYRCLTTKSARNILK